MVVAFERLLKVAQQKRLLHVVGMQNEHGVTDFEVVQILKFYIQAATLTQRCR